MNFAEHREGLLGDGAVELGTASQRATMGSAGRFDLFFLEDLKIRRFEGLTGSANRHQGMCEKPFLSQVVSRVSVCEP